MSCEEQLPYLPEERCPGCGGPNAGYLPFCRDCIETVGGRPWKLAVSAFPFTGMARRLIHLYKFRSCLAVAPFLAGHMLDAWNAYGGACRPDAIAYIPLHCIRHFTRGYNQAEILAEMLSEKLGIPKCKALRRTRMTSRQSSLDLKRRAINMRGAFSANGNFVAGKRILLVDDVFTTGTTFSVATKALLDAGAAEVYVLSAAKA